jgi:hypothetical protein
MFVGASHGTNGKCFGIKVVAIRARREGVETWLKNSNRLSSPLGDGGLSSVEARSFESRPRSRSFSDCPASFQAINMANATWSSAGRSSIVVIIPAALVAARSSVHHWLLSCIAIW